MARSWKKPITDPGSGGLSSALAILGEKEIQTKERRIDINRSIESGTGQS